MIKADEDALICDFAETYRIIDYKGLPASRAALLAVGLHDDSRIKRKMSGMVVSTEIMLLASIVDRLSLLVWMQTEDAVKKRNRPKSVLDVMCPKEKDSVSFDSGEDFLKTRQDLIKHGRM